MPTKNLGNRVADELRPEYDLAVLTGRVQGKHYANATAGTTLVLLEPDVARAFPTGRAVNRALRMYLSSKSGEPARRARKKTTSKRRSRAARG
jgi:hypothetical protein